ncbi:MAG: shikimate kinase [Clostridia bacterium]|nr:shikimate kinase [Clostridia bacterium]
MKNIVLIGMPGCGKSTCGVLVAKALCKSFVDTDLLIQSHEDMGLQEIIETKGNGYFSETEERILTELSNKNSVIATGGSAVYYENAMRSLKSGGIVIYLKISYANMADRIKNIKTRGILLRDGEDLRQMYSARVRLYEKYADVIIDCDGNDVEDTVEKICEAYKG